jgi:hypothetical protein
MIFDHAAGLLTPRFRQRIHEPRKETFALFYLWALGNGSAGGASAPIGHGHHVFLRENVRQIRRRSSPDAMPKRLIVS